MVISSINQEPTQSVTPFGTFSGSSSSDVTSVISNGKPSSEKGAITKTPKYSINDGANGQIVSKSNLKSDEKGTDIKTPKFLLDSVAKGQSALKSVKKISKTPQPKPSNPFKPSFSSLGTQEFNHAPKAPSPKPSFDFSLLNGTSIGSATPFARRIPCTFEPEKPLPPIFSLFD